ncbi:hypothetical protein YPPY10_0917, partial [Yersinia pestis PY-10]
MAIDVNNTQAVFFIN